MISTERELRHSIQTLAKQYNLVDKIAAQTTGFPETREDEIIGVKAAMCHVEGEIAHYLAAKYGYVKPEPVSTGTESTHELAGVGI